MRWGRIDISFFSFQQLRGLAILLHKAIPFTDFKTITDPTGRFIIVTGHMYDSKVALGNQYAPNWSDETRFILVSLNFVWGF